MISCKTSGFTVQIARLNYPSSRVQHLIKFSGFNMATSSKSTMKIISIALMVAGIGLAFWGFQLSGSVGSQLTQAVTGSDTDKVMTLYIAGAVSFIVGIYLFTNK
jgi:hypothetical protein